MKTVQYISKVCAIALWIVGIIKQNYQRKKTRLYPHADFKMLTLADVWAIAMVILIHENEQRIKQNQVDATKIIIEHPNCRIHLWTPLKTIQNPSKSFKPYETHQWRLMGTIKIHPIFWSPLESNPLKGLRILLRPSRTWKPHNFSSISCKAKRQTCKTVLKNVNCFLESLYLPGNLIFGQILLVFGLNTKYVCIQLNVCRCLC